MTFVAPIHGITDPRFQAVRDAFAAYFRDHAEVGAARCVYLRGRCVVDLLRRRIAIPVHLDAYIGLPPAHQHRVSRLIEPAAALRAESTALRRASAATTPRLDPNDPQVHAAEVPSSDGAHPAIRLAVGYVMNRMHTGVTTDYRFTNLATAITQSL